MAKRKYNLSPAGRAALLKTVEQMNADPAAKSERMRRQWADPEFRKRREEAYRKMLTDGSKRVGRPRKTAPVAADSVR